LSSIERRQGSIHGGQSRRKDTIGEGRVREREVRCGKGVGWHAGSRLQPSIIDSGLREMDEKKTRVEEATDLSASVQVLPMPVGLYLFSVQSATPTTEAKVGRLSLPALHVGLGPGVRSDHVQFVGGPSTEGCWLFAQGDMLVVKVTGAGAILVVTSIRAPGGHPLAIKVERLEERVDRTSEPAVAAKAAAPAAAKGGEKVDAPQAPAAAAAQEAAMSVREDGSLPIRINAHIRARGDRSFSDASWAGRVGTGLWIESFSLRPQVELGPGDIEYKGLTGTGFETPWTTDEQMCGTRGMSTPLLGYAVRLKPGSKAGAYDCEYSGYFQSGAVVGPLRNGAPCRSTVAGDPLEGIQVRVSRRAAAAAGASEGKSAPTAPAKTAPAKSAPAKSAPAKTAAVKAPPAKAPAKAPARAAKAKAPAQKASAGKSRGR
jgi:hypothetical protein